MVGLSSWLAVPVILAPLASVDLDHSTVYLVQHAGSPAPGPTEMDLEVEFRRSRDALRARPEFQGDTADAHYRLGKALHGRGDMVGGAEEYRLAIRCDPRFGEAYRDLGTLLLDWHDYPGAVAALEQAVQLGRQDSETYYWLGRGLMGKSDWPAAAAALETAVRIKPDDAEAYADLGLVRMVQGDVTGAADALRASIELKPDNADAHALLETLTLHHSDRDQVIRAAQQVLALMFRR
ncbi:MAG: tetratricopeptide repeat protein [Nitrospira sp.]|nr:tetratricopeptide repeat protein [Nitrospira sp.]